MRCGLASNYDGAGLRWRGVARFAYLPFGLLYHGGEVRGARMLTVWFGEMDGVILDTTVYFTYNYQLPGWKMRWCSR